VPLPRPSPCSAQAAAPGFTGHELEVISPDPEHYHGWPTLCRSKAGELIVTWSGGREAHVCPFGRVEMMTSKDDGRTWTYPRVLLDSAGDDRDSGCLETARGTRIATTFTSPAYQAVLDKQLGAPEGTRPAGRGRGPPGDGPRYR